MATTTTCDKCGKALKNFDNYKLIIQPLYPCDLIDTHEEYDLCPDCREQAIILVENFIYPKED